MDTIKIDNQDYNLNDLSEQARNLVTSLQYADRRLKELQDDVALTQTAINAYGMVLAKNLPEEAHPNKKNGVVTINNKKYVFDDFSEKARGNAVSIDKASKKLADLNAQIALVKTARAAYAKSLNESNELRNTSQH